MKHSRITPKGQTAGLSTLRKYHARLSAQLKASEKDADAIRGSLVHIENAIKIIDPKSRMSELANARRRPKVLTFGRGEPVRLLFQILREGKPLTVREIANRMVEITDRGPLDERGMYHLRHAVRHILKSHRDKVTVAEGVWPERWALIRPL